METLYTIGLWITWVKQNIVYYKQNKTNVYNSQIQKQEDKLKYIKLHTLRVSLVYPLKMG